MAIGDVKWFNRAKGFGFICPDTGPCDVFVHISAVHHSGIEMLFEGQRIEFELTQLADGRLSAFGLRPVESAETPESTVSTETPPSQEHQTQ